MQQFKRVQVIILPTENNGTIDTYDSGKICLTKEKTDWSWRRGFKELYIISDDEIKEGDWCYNIVSKTIFQADSQFIKLINQNEITTNKKIIATTDRSLKINTKWKVSGVFDDGLPQPSQQFIEKYIESYNKGEVIADVLVEYEDYDWDLLTSGNTTIHQRVKVNPKDNTITIKKLKDSWNREELKVLFKKHEKDVIKYINGSGASATPSFNDKWIKENL